MRSQGERLDVLASLVGGLVVGDGTVSVVDATHDSRQVIAGGLFIAIVGASFDGHAFCDAAVRAGAGAIMVEEQQDLPVPQLIVDDTRAAMAPVAAAVHGNPSRDLRVVGITGTNGKTTTSFLVESMIRTRGERAGLIGTVFTRAGDDLIPNVRTTPEATDFQRILAAMRARGVDVVAAEVSSHAVALGRVDATWFEVAAFTNLSPDHLDFHGDMRSYFEAKAALFTTERVGTAIINVADEYGAELASRVESKLITVGPGMDVSGRVLSATPRSSRIEFTLPRGVTREALLPLAGSFNLENALVAAACGMALGLSADEIAAGLEAAPQVPGRFEVVSGADPVTVIVDYAHTPAGIEAVLAAARHSSPRRIIAVVGAGGDRDRAKRPAMGSAAAAGADLVVVTSDNPRSEDPAAIITEMLSGMPSSADSVVEPDRRSAIRAAIDQAGAGDVVLILGKGHERGQEIAGRIIPFDDRQEARAALAERGRR